MPMKPSARKIRLSDFLSENHILIWENTALKEEVLRDLARTVCSTDEEQQDIFTRLLRREKESSTFFNEGVAFPHLRLEEDSLPRVALGILPWGIADVVTMEPIRLVFLIVTSLRQSDIQAKLLAAASRIASNKRLVDILLAAKNPEKVIKEISKWED
jgi:mannitol/fructose-specific phosphotransferase system IIA component (Ntr-type)